MDSFADLLTENGVETDLEVTKTDVYSDFEKYRQEAGIEEWKGKFVSRKYAFEDSGVEKGESEWMKVVYGFDRKSKLCGPQAHTDVPEPELPHNASGPTFSHIFGTNTSPFELLVIKRKIMGPCWLEIKNASQSSKSVRRDSRTSRADNPDIMV